jgi:hypothetical protein
VIDALPATATDLPKPNYNEMNRDSTDSPTWADSLIKDVESAVVEVEAPQSNNFVVLIVCIAAACVLILIIGIVTFYSVRKCRQSRWTKRGNTATSLTRVLNGRSVYVNINVPPRSRIVQPDGEHMRQYPLSREDSIRSPIPMPDDDGAAQKFLLMNAMQHGFTNQFEQLHTKDDVAPLIEHKSSKHRTVDV